MRIPARLTERLHAWSKRLRESRPPDFLIGDPTQPYLRRWWVIPRNRWFNIYLHEVLRSDDDRALHDHPWLNCSVILAGGYHEHRIAAGGCHTRNWRGEGSLTFRGPRAAHRLEVARAGPRTVTLFITGPIVRHWGFHCPSAGWRHWRDFTGPADKGQVGRGCGEMVNAHGHRLAPRRGGWRLPGLGE